MWRKSSFSAGNGACLEVAFRKSSFSGDSANCVEVGFRTASASATNGCCVAVGACEHGVLVRDSKDPDGPVLSFTRAEWSAFLAGAKAGEFDL